MFFLETKPPQKKKWLGSFFTPPPTYRLLLWVMRNGCLEHLPGWNDSVQALSFVTLIAHLSGSWRKASLFFSNRFWPFLHVLPWPSEMGVCVSFIWHCVIGPCCRTVSRKDPAHASVVEAVHHITDRTLWRTVGNGLQIFLPAPSVLPPWKLGLLFSLGTVWALYKDGFSLCLRVAEIKFTAQDGDYSSLGVWDSMFAPSLWLYYSPSPIFLWGFSWFFIWCFLRHFQSSGEITYIRAVRK